jgi:uncharacterized protein with GYD domain
VFLASISDGRFQQVSSRVAYKCYKEFEMPKYLFQGHYTNEGIKGVLKEGGTGRRAAVEKLATSMGGKLETFYFALGDDDYFIIVDLPDITAAAAVALTVAASGAAVNKTTVLMTPEEVDQAAKKHPSYRPPGQ